MKSALKSALKAALPRTARRLLEYRARQRSERASNELCTVMFNEWIVKRETVATTPIPSHQAANRALILPGDAGTVTGSIGDDAMISAAVTQLRRQDPNIEIDILCHSGAIGHISSLGFAPVVLPPETDFSSGFLQILKDGIYRVFIILGADIMDGYYHTPTAASAIIAADLAARSGAKAVFLGFSFNKRPTPALRPLFDNVHPAVQLNVRDSASLERFSEFTTSNARLVADSAYCLVPGPIDVEVESWVDRMHDQGRTVLGFNLHAMLIRHSQQGDWSEIAASGAAAIRQASIGRNVAWLLFPHDYRKLEGDGNVLSLIYEALQSDFGDTIRFLDGHRRAADLKAIATTLDGVVSARMHLAIAALGSGVPTLCVAYQDKFEGMFQDFGLPPGLVLPSSILGQDEALGTAVGHFIDNLADHRNAVARQLPEMMRRAHLNFDSID